MCALVLIMGNVIMKQSISWFIRHLLFPIMLGTGLILMINGISKGYNLELTTMMIASVVVVIVLLAERAVPFKPEWNKSRDDVFTDLSSLAVILVILEPLAKLVSTWLITILLVWLGQHSSVDIFPNHWPIMMQLALFAITAEFGRYWMHRFSHTNSVLWRFHASHHSSNKLYQFNGYRIHPFNHLWNYFLGQFPLILLGAGSDVVMVYFVFSSIVAAFQHANIDSRNGPLNYIFSTNELHRWHHTTERSVGLKNHGSVLILWDLLFGTYHSGKDKNGRRETLEKVGIYSPKRYPINSYLKQLVVPFCWKRCVEND